MPSWLVASVVLVPVAALVAGAIFTKSVSSSPPYPVSSTGAAATVTPFRALVLGPSGATGQSLVSQLAASPHCTQVITIGRRPAPNVTDSKVVHHTFDLADMKSHASLFTGIDVVYCTLGSRVRMGEEVFRSVDYTAPLTAARLAKDAGVPSYQLMTSLGSDASSSMLYTRTKGQVEEDLKKIGLPRTTILRPSLLIATREQPRMAEMIFERVAKYGGNAILRGGLRKYRSITVEDVATSMMANTIWQRSSSPVAQNGKPIVELYESDIIQDMADHFKSANKPHSA